jgi:hypothetical protein
MTRLNSRLVPWSAALTWARFNSRARSTWRKNSGHRDDHGHAHERHDRRQCQLRDPDGSAVSPDDYTPTSGTLNFADGEVIKIFTVPIVYDSLQ